MNHKTLNIQSNNKTLYAEIWQPENPKAIVVLVHGMGEHLGRYAESVVPTLLENNYAVLAYDQIGHGKTKGKKGHTPSYDALLDSLQAVITEAKNQFPDKSVFLYGHSMGGNVVINYSIRRQPKVKAVVATNPLLRLAFEPPKWKISLGRIMLNILPSITLPSELDTTSISRDAEEVKRYEVDDLVHDKISPMYSFPVFDAGEYAIKNANNVNVPMLVCHGTGDKITSHKASEEFANNSENVELKLFEGAYHEMHHDLNRVEFLESVVDWLELKLRQ